MRKIFLMIRVLFGITVRQSYRFLFFVLSETVLNLSPKAHTKRECIKARKTFWRNSKQFLSLVGKKPALCTIRSGESSPAGGVNQ